MVDSPKVEERRLLRFDTIDDMLDDARACVAARRLRQLGNWPIGTALNHVAAWIEYPYVGYPPELVFSESVKASARAARERIMREPMRPGERIPGVAAGTLAIEDVSAEAALARLDAAAATLRSSEPTHEDPAFGVITRREWTEMSLRHAELHLGFFVAE